MGTSGTKFPTVAADYYEGAWSDLPWYEPENVCADDETVAAIPWDFNEGLRSTVLHVYGFDFSAIPSGATIDGVECAVSCLCVGDVSCDLMQLLSSSGSRTGTNQCYDTVPVPYSEAEIVEGGPADTWACALTVSWVQDSDFGVGIGFVSNLNESQLFVDYVTITVWYTPAEGGIGAKVVSTGRLGRPTTISGG